MIESIYSKIFYPVLLTIALVFFAHEALLNYVLPDLYTQTLYGYIYLFLVPITLIGMTWMVHRYKRNNKSLGKNFFVYTIIKMVSTLGFLSPWLINKSELTRPFVYQFMLVFFLLLFIETFQLVRLLNGKFE